MTGGEGGDDIIEEWGLQVTLCEAGLPELPCVLLVQLVGLRGMISPVCVISWWGSLMQFDPGRVRIAIGIAIAAIHSHALL